MSLKLWLSRISSFLSRSFDNATQRISQDASTQERSARKVKMRQLEDRVLMSASPAGAETVAAGELAEAQEATINTDDPSDQGRAPRPSGD